jgi:hypothetical protein|tara:strand:- start:5609 stop:6127 length:519 start_codon:yes stop_codon:yes gene_type:complete
MKHYITVLSQKDLGVEFFDRLDVGIKIALSDPQAYLVINSEAALSLEVSMRLNQYDDLMSRTDRILLQTRSKDTIGEAYYLKERYLCEGDKVTVVSSDYHLKYRAKIVFDFILGSDVSVDYAYVRTEKLNDPAAIRGQLDSLQSFLSLFNRVDYNKFSEIKNTIFKKHKLYT